MFLKNIKKRNALRNYTITSPIIADYFTLEVILKLLQITIAGMIFHKACLNFAPTSFKTIFKTTFLLYPDKGILKQKTN